MTDPRQVTLEDQFLLHLQRAFEIESTFESLMEWEGYIATKDPHVASLVLKLYSESETHAQMLRKLIAKIRHHGERWNPAQHPSDLDLRDKAEGQILKDILAFEKDAHKAYSEMSRILSEPEAASLVISDDIGSILSTVNILRNAELRHIRAVERAIEGKFDDDS